MIREGPVNTPKCRQPSLGARCSRVGGIQYPTVGTRYPPITSTFARRFDKAYSISSFNQNLCQMKVSRALDLHVDSLPFSFLDGTEQDAGKGGSNAASDREYIGRS